MKPDDSRHWTFLASDSTEESRFEPDEQAMPCLDPSHNPPGMMVIPIGQKYIHICPTCRKKTVLRSSGTLC